MNPAGLEMTGRKGKGFCATELLEGSESQPIDMLMRADWGFLGILTGFKAVGTIPHGREIIGWTENYLVKEEDKL